MESYKKPPFSMTDGQMKKKKKKKNREKTSAQNPKEFIYEVLSRGFGEMDLGRQTDRRTEVWTEGRTDEAMTICSPFGKRNKQYNYEVS